MAHLITGNKFDPDKDIPDLDGRVYVVTGGTAGIGFGITAHLLQHNAARVIVLSQKEEHADESKEELKKYGDESRIEWIQLDLKDLKQTDKVAKRLTNERQIDALICNAGEGVGKYNETVDGIACPSETTFTSLDEINTDLGPANLYNRTKLAQVLTVRTLARRMENNEPGFQTNKQMGPWINATHPGGVSTDQQDQAIDAYGSLGKLGVKAVRPLLSDPVSKGCRSGLFAATSDDITKGGIQGQYIVPDRKVTEPSKKAMDVELGENLWRLSEQLLVEKLGTLPYVHSV
ncbi:MAG: hypothetical protein Q9191_000364 [Dirinaria sp. TL-2023a]